MAKDISTFENGNNLDLPASQPSTAVNSVDRAEFISRTHSK